MFPEFIERLAQEVKGEKDKHNVTIFTLSTCMWCKKCKVFLGERGIQYRYVDIDKIDISEKSKILEYLRAFLLGRMAWSRLNGLLVISGAFGIFDKEIAIAVGGYDTETVGEDMEIIVRMRRYMEELGKKYIVSYIPDPLCWTEAPDNYKTRQIYHSDRKGRSA